MSHKNHIFDRRETSPETYAHSMMEHLQEVEDGLKALKEAEEEGIGLSQMWSFDHKDGRIARIPDKYPTEYWHERSKKRDKEWMQHLMRKYQINEDE